MDDTTKRVIRSILLANGKPCTVQELAKNYFETEGEQIDFRKLGFASLESCLLKMPDVCKLQYFGRECYVDRVSTAETQHMDLLTKAIQKKSVTRRKRFTPQPPRNYMKIKISRFYPVANPQPIYKPLCNAYNRVVPTHVFKDTVPKSNINNNNFVVSVQNDIRYIARPNNFDFSQHPSSKPKNVYSNQPVLKQKRAIVKSIHKPVHNASKSKFVFKRDVPTLVFKDTVEQTADTNSTFPINVEEEIKMVPNTSRSDIESHDNYKSKTKSPTPSLKSHFSKSSMEIINSKSIPSYALINSALNEIKIQKKKDNQQYDIPDITNLNLDDEPNTTLLGQLKEPKLSDIDKEISSLLLDDPIYLIEFPEIIQDCTYKIPSPMIRKTKADLNFELYISEVHSPTQFWFQYGEGDLEELMNYMKDFYSELRKDDLSISAINAKPGLIVAVFLFSKWQRAEILSGVDKTNQLLVFFFDYGTKERIDLKNVKYLLKTFSKIPRKALCGCLHGIKPTNGDATWKIMASLVLLEKIEDKRLFGKVVNHREEENVFELIVKENKDARYSLSEILVAEGYAAPSSKLTNGI